MDASASRKRPRDEAAKAKKPAMHEYVGGPGEALLTEEALRSALAHLAEHDDHMRRHQGGCRARSLGQDKLRSVGYLLINAAKEGTAELVLA